MSIARLNLGKSGEEKATQFLENQGYKIVERNYKSRLGELDIIAHENNRICFIEVRTRSSLSKGDPLESITPRKQHKLSKIALSYLKSHKLLNEPARFDVISVCEDGANTDIRLIKNAFDLVGIYTY